MDRILASCPKLAGALSTLQLLNVQFLKLLLALGGLARWFLLSMINLYGLIFKTVSMD